MKPHEVAEKHFPRYKATTIFDLEVEDKPDTTYFVRMKSKIHAVGSTPKTLVVMVQGITVRGPLA